MRRIQLYSLWKNSTRTSRTDKAALARELAGVWADRKDLTDTAGLIRAMRRESRRRRAR